MHYAGPCIEQRERCLPFLILTISMCCNKLRWIVNAADILADFILFLSQAALHSSIMVKASVPGSLHLFDLFWFSELCVIMGLQKQTPRSSLFPHLRHHYRHHLSTAWFPILFFQLEELISSPPPTYRNAFDDLQRHFCFHINNASDIVYHDLLLHDINKYVFKKIR